METPSLMRQIISVACAPIYANTAGEPLQRLGGQDAVPGGGLPLQHWPFGEGLPRSWHGQLSPGPGATGPVAPVGVSITPDHLPQTGYLYALPERQTGRVVHTSG